MYRFSSRSLKKLEGVDVRLILLASRALAYSPVDFAITHGVRDPAEQALLVEQGKSKTMNSKHLKGLALDVAAYVDGEVTWEWERYVTIADAFKRAADQLGIRINCGVDWKDFPDGCHIELK